jgi:hypothetical protein
LSKLIGLVLETGEYITEQDIHAENIALKQRIAELQAQIDTVASGKELLIKCITEDMEFIQRVSYLASDAKEQFDKRQKLLTVIEKLSLPPVEQEQG